MPTCALLGQECAGTMKWRHVALTADAIRQGLVRQGSVRQMQAFMGRIQRARIRRALNDVRRGDGVCSENAGWFALGARDTNEV